ncbi:hypothetical protein TNCV_3628121 [Trichonephila clavipes]|nr:hypothetical protein TNCV_3628121 [Trichonephila clavipes]
MDFFVKAVSKSATFVFTMDALPDHFLPAPDLVSWNRCTKRVIVDVSRGLPQTDKHGKDSRRQKDWEPIT